MLVEIATLLMAGFAGVGALAGAIAARAKDRAVASFAGDAESVEPHDANAGPYRTRARVTASKRPMRPSRIFRHDYDRMIGRTLMR